MRIPRAVKNLVESFERLPGVGPKTAARLTFYLLHVPQGELDRFAHTLQNLRKDTVICSLCFGIDEHDPCSICTDLRRDGSIICVVEQPLDILALEKSGKFNGLYHVLHGRIDPLSNIGPDEIRISELLSRIKNSARGEVKQESPLRPDQIGATEGQAPLRQDYAGQARIKEIILATNPTMEGEATAMYIAKKLGELKSQNSNFKITRIGRGLPTGADLEYADSMTLERAMEGRREY